MTLMYDTHMSQRVTGLDHTRWITDDIDVWFDTYTHQLVSQWIRHENMT